MKRPWLYLLILILLMTGCTSQEAHLIYLSDQSEVPEALVTPTPHSEPDLIAIAPIEGDGFPLDPNGLPILNEQTHYYDYYLSVSNLRIYEYEGETLIDATITNSFSRPLTGGLCITFYDNGLKYGYAEFYTAAGGLKLFPGENRVFADVLSEVDVQMMDFEISVAKPFVPDE
ncbi:MAG: hypothetical protein IJJ86_01670 [Clostridia bacterium]|nr:hypothetical protein [Clostridia bacterium]